ncbi:hypothetical protein [Sinorhizobium fredii]|uniref:hypothetical protein n=1 Tax=Rhizobium fredii TaxID=380 RepID=UPI0004B62463|nr:hypothetical protein [Sinorhizobium fredii]
MRTPDRQPWTEDDTIDLVRVVAATSDPAVAASAVIGAMIGVIETSEGREFARSILHGIVQSPLLDGNIPKQATGHES